MKIVVIEGWPASGKTALWALLDGLDGIFVEPLHTYWFEALAVLFANEIENRLITVRELRGALATTEYFKQEQYSLVGSFPISFSSGKQKNWPFHFDFYRFDRELVEKVCDGKEKNALEFANIYTSLYQKFYMSGKNIDYDYFVTMSNYFNYKAGILEKFPSLFKFIAITRPSLEILASRTAREPRVEDGKRIEIFSPSLGKLFKESELEEIESFNNFYKKLSENDQHKCFCISLDGLLARKDVHLREICKFIGVSFQSVALTGTRDGTYIESDGFELTKRVNDDARFLLSDSTKLGSFIRISVFKAHRLPVNIFSFYAILRYTYLKFKKIR